MGENALLLLLWIQFWKILQVLVQFFDTVAIKNLIIISVFRWNWWIKLFFGLPFQFFKLCFFLKHLELSLRLPWLNNGLIHLQKMVIQLFWLLDEFDSLNEGVNLMWVSLPLQFVHVLLASWIFSKLGVASFS